MWQKDKEQATIDPSEWAMVILSWMVYLGGLVFFPDTGTSWVLLALGALPVLVTGWTLGMVFGLAASGLSVSLHLLLEFVQTSSFQTPDTTLFRHLVGFALLTIMGMLIGHMRDLQRKTQLELRSLRLNNQRLIRLSEFLETVNQQTTALITSSDWTQNIPSLIENMGTALGIDHIYLLQLSGNGPLNYTGKIYHTWTETDDSDTEVVTQEYASLPEDITNWISSLSKGSYLDGSVEDLAPEMYNLLSCQTEGSYLIYPVFARTALWGFLGFETCQMDYQWNELEINTMRSAALTLGSTFYKKLMEKDLDLRAKELQSLQKTSSDVSAAHQLETGLTTVLSQILELTPAYDTNIYLYTNQSLEFYISLGKNRQQSLPFSHPGELALTSLVAETRQDLFISNLEEFNVLDDFHAHQPEALISFALKAASEVIGVLNIWFSTTRDFQSEEKTILRLLADQAATAILNIQFIQAEREQRLLADSLRKATLQLSDNLDLKQVLESILDQVLSLVSARDAYILLYDGKELTFGAVMHSEDVLPDPIPLPEKDSIFYETIDKREKILVSDIQAESRIHGTWKTGSLISLPLIFHRKVIGVMNVSFFEPGELGEPVLQVLDLLSNQAAIAINNARTFEAEREQRKLAQALQHTGRAIQSSLDLEVVLDQILTQIGSVIKYHSANLMLVEGDFVKVVRQHGYQTEPEAEPEDDLPSLIDMSKFATLQKMTETKQPLIISDTQKDILWVQTNSTALIRSWAGAPILDGDDVIGFLSLNNQNKNYYRAEHAETLSAFASQASIALKHARLHQEIQDMAVKDPLTKVFNRRGLNQWGQYEIDRAMRFNSPLSAIFFDLDQFKTINDTYGHDVGDIVLQKIVHSCQEVIRKIDIFARIGGEEFIIILPETSQAIAIQVAERLRETVAAETLQVKSHQIKVTISLGVAEMNQDISDLQALISAADQYMYQAKASGRNKTAYQMAN